MLLNLSAYNNLLSKLISDSQYFISRCQYRSWWGALLTGLRLVWQLQRSVSTVKQGDNALGSVRPSVRPFVCLLIVLSFCKIGSKRLQQKVFFPQCITSLRCLSVSVNLRAFAANFADAVDWLLMWHIFVAQYSTVASWYNPRKINVADERVCSDGWGTSHVS